MSGKAVDDGPTTMNGPLSRAPQSVQERMISAEFADRAAGDHARTALLGAGIEASRIAVDHATDIPEITAQSRAADRTLLATLREAVVPDEITVAARGAIDRGAAIVRVTPALEQVEIVVRTLQACHPSKFDADLERWRNNG